MKISAFRFAVPPALFALVALFYWNGREAVAQDPRPAARIIKFTEKMAILAMPPEGNPDIDMKLVGITGPGRAGVELPPGQWCVVSPMNDEEAFDAGKFLDEFRATGAEGLVASRPELTTGANINKLLECKNLRMLGFGEVELSAESLASLAKLPLLYSLSFQGNRTLRGKLGVLREIKTLRELGLSATNITESDLKLAGELQQLRMLDLSNCKIMNKDLAAIAKLTNLERLYLDFTGVDDGVAGGLAPFVRLKLLNCLGTPVGDATVASLQKTAPALEAFASGKRGELSPITNQGLASLAAMPLLKHLAVAGLNPLNDASCVIVARARGLETLVLNGLTRLQYAGPFSLARVGGSRTLDNSLRAITREGVAALAPLKMLKTLSLGGFVNINESVFEPLAAFEKLENIDLSGTSVTGAGFVKLSAANGLQTVCLGSSPFNDEGAAALAKFSALRRLYLGDTKITNQSIPMFAKLQKLEVLGIGSTAVDDQGVAALAGCASLKSLFLTGTRATPEIVKILRSKSPELEVKL